MTDERRNGGVDHAPGTESGDAPGGAPDGTPGGEPTGGREKDHSTVHLTRIYTKTGDDGTTALGDMSRVRKTDPRIGAYAAVDEANAAIGTAIALGELPADMAELLTKVQNDLFDVGADLCTPVVDNPPWAPLRVTADYATRLEEACDRYNADLPKLDSFVLPGGSRGAALLHVARTVVRRAERETWQLLEADPDHTGKQPALYLNRLSDLLFILSRAANREHGDVLWRPRGKE